MTIVVLLAHDHRRAPLIGTTVVPRRIAWRPVSAEIVVIDEGVAPILSQVPRRVIEQLVRQVLDCEVVEADRLMSEAATGESLNKDLLCEVVVIEIRSHGLPIVLL